MASLDALGVFLESLGKKSYYDVLRVAQAAPPAAVKEAFHAFSLLYHPDRFVGSAEEGRVAGEIYKRGVEAYRCLSRPATRERYDRALRKGNLRADSKRTSTLPPPPPPLRTLETVATTASGKQYALRADRLITAGKLDDARVQLASACQCEPENAELAERLKILWEALALEPG